MSRFARSCSAVALLLAGCQNEGGIREPGNPFGVPNPQDFGTPVQVDRFVQTTIPSVDILFVVDNSCSMAEEQAALSTNFPSMLDWFIGSGLDYHVGVVSTDMNDPLHTGRLRVSGGARWIDESTPSPEGTFSEMVTIGTGGHWDEKGRAAAYTAIELLGGSDNEGFVREEAGMHITVVSDENDASGESPISRDEFVDYLNTLRWSARMVSFSSIVGPLTGCPYIGSVGTEYLTVTGAVGGVVWPICADDWTAVLDELGFVATGLSREFFLSHLPVEETIEVRVIDPYGVVFDFATPTDWLYDRSRNSIEFVEYVPDSLSIVEVEYEVDAEAGADLAVGGSEPPQ